jgi:hypothetical protein
MVNNVSPIPKVPKSKDPVESSERSSRPKAKKKASKEKEEPGLESTPEEPSDSSSGPPWLRLALSTVMEVVSAKPCQLRTEFELTSDKAGEVGGGTVVYVLEQRQTADGATRMSVCPEGQSASIGWLTGVTKDGKQNLQELGRPVCEVIASKPLAARATFELTSGKAGEVACKALIHVLEARETSDGAHRVAYALAGEGTSPKGWVTAITKDGSENVSLVKDFKGHKAGGAPAVAPTGAAPSSPSSAPSGKRAAKAPAAPVAAAPAPAAGSSSVPPAAAKLIIASRIPASVISAKVRAAGCARTAARARCGPPLTRAALRGLCRDACAAPVRCVLHAARRRRL